jgi:hypothetical protein
MRALKFTETINKIETTTKPSVMFLKTSVTAAREQAVQHGISLTQADLQPSLALAMARAV